jgi:hypothetical protein
MRLTVSSLAIALLMPFASLADWRGDFDADCAMLLTPPVDTWVKIPNLIAQWTMNDNAANTTVANAKNTYYNGTAARNTSGMSVAGKINTALSFTNKSDFVQFNTLTNVSTLMSYSMWLYPTNLSSSIVPMGGSYYLLYLNVGGNYIFCHNGLAAQVSWATDIKADKWTHVALTQNGTTMTLYTNGITCGNQTLTSGGQKPVYIGRTTASGTIGWAGYIDDVRIYNNCISSQEVVQLYNAGNGTERE